MKKKLFFVSALALLTTCIALNTESTVSASSTRLSSLNVRNILNEYDDGWDAGTYNSQLSYWMRRVWTSSKEKPLTADDIRKELDELRYNTEEEND
ncbi:hypothetical protein [Streptococcus canis]|uniref:hypothetical protein n=1 Tax=Streptococcus canis TaxID=1329 RepID=UPI0040363843